MHLCTLFARKTAIRVINIGPRKAALAEKHRKNLLQLLRFVRVRFARSMVISPRTVLPSREIASVNAGKLYKTHTYVDAVCIPTANGHARRQFVERMVAMKIITSSYIRATRTPQTTPVVLHQRRLQELLRFISIYTKESYFVSYRSACMLTENQWTPSRFWMEVQIQRC